jgi:hypothetical protein
VLRHERRQPLRERGKLGDRLLRLRPFGLDLPRSTASSASRVSLDPKQDLKSLDVGFERRVALPQGFHERLFRRTYGRGLRGVRLIGQAYARRLSFPSIRAHLLRIARCLTASMDKPNRAAASA